MMTHPLLPKLKQLRLSGMLLTLDARAAQATERGLTPTEFLAIMLDDELERRDQTRLARLVSEAGIDPGKTLAQFDFASAPQVNRTLVMELATCTFLHRAENVLFSGPTGDRQESSRQRLGVGGSEAWPYGLRSLRSPPGRRSPGRSGERHLHSAVCPPLFRGTLSNRRLWAPPAYSSGRRGSLRADP
jgi:hypothetical protein